MLSGEAVGKARVITPQNYDEEGGTIAKQERDWTLSVDEVGESKNSWIRMKRKRVQGTTLREAGQRKLLERKMV